MTTASPKTPPIVSRTEWNAARERLLEGAVRRSEHDGVFLCRAHISRLRRSRSPPDGVEIQQSCRIGERPQVIA